MELGRGAWELAALRDLFLKHLGNYERIFTLRCLNRGPLRYEYELVEIPKPLLLQSQAAKLSIQTQSRQTPQPGYGHVEDATGRPLYSLYFDGGTERKLQIKGLSKSLCRVHATWIFDSAPLEGSAAA